MERDRKKNPRRKRPDEATPAWRAALLDDFDDFAGTAVADGARALAATFESSIEGPEPMRSDVLARLSPEEIAAASAAGTRRICEAFARAIESGGAAALAAAELRCGSSAKAIRPLLFKHFVLAFMEQESRAPTPNAPRGPRTREQILAELVDPTITAGRIAGELLREAIPEWEHAERLQRRRSETRKRLAKETVERRGQRMGGDVARSGTAFAAELHRALVAAGVGRPWLLVASLVRAFLEPDLPSGPAGAERLRQRTKLARNLIPGEPDSSRPRPSAMLRAETGGDHAAPRWGGYTDE